MTNALCLSAASKSGGGSAALQNASETQRREITATFWSAAVFCRFEGAPERTFPQAKSLAPFLVTRLRR
jgi:hypothetical protein